MITLSEYRTLSSSAGKFKFIYLESDNTISNTTTNEIAAIVGDLSYNGNFLISNFYNTVTHSTVYFAATGITFSGTGAPITERDNITFILRYNSNDVSEWGSLGSSTNMYYCSLPIIVKATDGYFLADVLTAITETQLEDWDVTLPSSGVFGKWNVNSPINTIYRYWQVRKQGHIGDGASKLQIWLANNPPKEPDTDPYSDGGNSEPGGGGGTFDDTSDPNPIPSDPTISATDTGFMTVFATNLAGIQSLSNSLWADIFPATLSGGALEETVQALKNIVGSPYDAILGCHIVPVAVPQGAAKNVKLYGVLPSSVSLNVAASQWVHKDCGTLTIPHFDGSYLDYAPYTKVTSMYLPFIGVVPIDIDIIMDTTIGVYYKIDIISGQCIAYITKNGDVYFQYQGQCAVPLPVTSIDWTNTVNAGLGIIGSISGIVGSAVGGFGAAGAAGALAGLTKGFMGEAGSMAQNVMNSKPDIKSGSGIGGSAALMGCKNPYLIIERPRKSTPKIGSLSQNHWTGYPSNIAARLGDLEGYTEVSRIFVNRTTATAEEKQEIERLLTEGVYI